VVSSAVLDRRKPLVLLVEDRQESLRRRRDLFESFECTAIAVKSRHDAERELLQVPLVDLVVTDIHMPEDASDEDDKSGIALARHVHENFRDVPVAGYSAYFSDVDLEAEDLGIFDAIFPKGNQSADALAGQVEKCVALAIAARDRRLARLEERLDELRREYEVTIPEVEVVRRLSLDPDLDRNNGLVEGPLGEAGYRLRLVTASSINASEPFVVWVWTSADDEGVHVEVYAQPDLYAFGDNEADALSQLAELMRLVAEDSRHSRIPISPRLRGLYSFVGRVFGRR